MDRRHSLLHFVVLLTVVSVGILALMLMRTSSLTGPFTLEPSEQWIVRQEQPGEIVAQQTAGRRAVINAVTVHTFNDADVIGMNLAANLAEGTMVTAGTPVMELLSLTDQATEKMLVARVRRLTEQVTQLRVGEGPAKVEEAQAGLALAVTNLASYAPMIARRRALVDQGALSYDELQQMEVEFFKRQMDVNVARTAMGVRQSQMGPSVIAAADAELEESVRELELVRARLAARWLVTPVSGCLTRYSGNPGILLRVMNVHDLLARIVVPIMYIDRVKPGDQVQLIFSGVAMQAITSVIDRVEASYDPVLGQSLVYLLVPVNNRDDRLQVAMSGQAVLRAARINPLAMVWQRLNMAGFGRARVRSAEP